MFFGHIVLIFHPQDFFPKLELLIKIMFGFGHQAVILFFIVSGFSIHYSTRINNRNIFSDQRNYYLSRWKRIYPLFFLAIVLSMIVLVLTDMKVEISRIILSFLFLTDISTGSIVNPIPTNFPIWSLSYEVAYYILYPLLWLYIKRYRIQKVFLYSIIVSLAAFVFSSLIFPNHFTNVLQYFWTWVAGVFLAELKWKNFRLSIVYIKGLIIFSMALMLTLENVFVLRDWFWALFFILIFLSYYPKTEVTSKTSKLFNFGIGLMGILIAFSITYIDSAVFHPRILKYVLLGIFLLSLVITFIPLTYILNILSIVLKPFVFSGAFSYAIYIFHWPFIILTQFFLIDWAELNVFNMLLVIALIISFTLLFSWFLEKKMQPRIVNSLFKVN